MKSAQTVLYQYISELATSLKAQAFAKGQALAALAMPPFMLLTCGRSILYW